MKSEIYRYPANTVIVITNDVDRLYIDLDTDGAERNEGDAYNYNEIIKYVETCVDNGEELENITIDEIDFINPEARPE